MAKGRLSFRVLIGILIGWVVLFGIWRVVQAPREAKTRLAYMRHVLAVVAQYAREHAGAWPRSWEDIEKTRPPKDAPTRETAWPEVRTQIKVDFQADPRKLLEVGPEQFEAIAPRGACGDYRADVQRLLQAIRESLPPAASEKVSGSPPGRPSQKVGPESSPSEPVKQPKSADSPGTKATSETSVSSKESALGKSSPREKPSVLSKEPLGEEKKPPPPLPAGHEKPSPKEKSEPSSKPSPKIVLPGLE